MDISPNAQFAIKNAMSVWRAQWKINRERHREARAAYKKLPRIAEANRKWQRDNAEKVRAYSLAWIREHIRRIILSYTELKIGIIMRRSALAENIPPKTSLTFFECKRINALIAAQSWARNIILITLCRSRLAA